jgi:hypothetical protein
MLISRYQNYFVPCKFTYSDSCYNEMTYANRRYMKLLADRNEKSIINKILFPAGAGEPEIKRKPTFLSIVVVSSLLGISFYFYNRWQ